MNSFKKLIIPFIAVVLSLGFVKGDSDKFYQMSKAIDIFGKIYKEVTLNYVDDINPSEFMLEGVKGMLSSLDPYTNYIDEAMKKDIDLMTTGKYGGIGASVGIREGDVTIIDLVEGYSAQRQGIRIGDVIREVGDIVISKENYSELSNYLKGDPGKVVTIMIERDGFDDLLTFNLVLEEVIVKNLTYYGFIPESSNNVYLKLSSFTRGAGEEIKNAIIELRQQKPIESIVLDLRNNPGGLLDQAIDVSEKFLKKDQLIVSVVGRDSTKIARYYSKEEPIAGDAKLVVLVNGNTASASEIVSGAIQDHDRGVILGEQSFGKGLVQTVIPLSYNTSLKITTARYYTPSGRCIQKIDYSDNSKVIDNIVQLNQKQFKTDNNRDVYSAGGVDPDTVVTNSSESSQVESLLARGMFFNFATNFYNSNTNFRLNDFNDNQYFDHFITYLSEQEFNYTSKSEKLLNELEKLTSEEHFTEEIRNSVKELAAKFDEEKMRELVEHKSDIVKEIRKELAARLFGRDGRIVESLKNDNQFDHALQILDEGVTYSQLLALGE